MSSSLLQVYVVCLCTFSRLCSPLVLSLESGPNLTPLDVGESRRRRRLHLDDVLRVALSSIARTRLSAVEPLHEAALVPPDTHRQHHATAQRLAHTLHSAQFHEHLSAISNTCLIVQGDVPGLVLEDDAVLDVLALDRLKRAVRSGELSDNSEGLSGVDLEAKTVEVLRTVSVRVLAAAVLVAEPSSSALIALAREEAGLAAGVGCDLSGAAVGFPDVHLVAADARPINVALYSVSKSRRKLMNDNLQHR